MKCIWGWGVAVGLLVPGVVLAQRSKPVVPAQPDQVVYGIQALGLFQTYSRDTYLKAFGVQAPPFDPSRRIKTWFDSTVDTSYGDSVAVYKIIGQDSTGAWAVRQIAMPASEAAAVNLPGDIAYPPYVVTPTTATRGGTLLNADYMSLESQGRQIIAAIQAGTLLDQGDTALLPAVYPPEEPRKLWVVQLDGKSYNVGLLLKLQNAKGVGSPGRWGVVSGELTWIPDPPAPTGLADTRPPREMPVRDLLPNEVLQSTLFGVQVVRSDKKQQSDEQSGQFTSADRDMLRQILDLLKNKTQ